MEETVVGIGIIGFVVGLLVGMTGTGGGTLTTPILIIWLGLRPLVAVGTGLVFLSVIKAIGAWAHHRSGNVDWRLVRLMALGSVPGAIIGILLLFGLRGISEELLDAIVTRLLAAVVITASLAILARFLLGERSAFRLSPMTRESRDEPSRRFTVVLGFVVGVLVSLTSVGGGTLVLAALVLFYGLSGRRMVGTDIAHALVLTSIAALGHLGTQSVDLPLAGNLLAGAIPGTLLGSRITVRFPERGLRGVLAAVLLFAGLSLL